MYYQVQIVVKARDSHAVDVLHLHFDVFWWEVTLVASLVNPIVAAAANEPNALPINEMIYDQPIVLMKVSGGVAGLMDR